MHSTVFSTFLKRFYVFVCLFTFAVSHQKFPMGTHSRFAFSEDFRRNQRAYSGVEIKGETVERVKSHKYLGLTVDDKQS